ncbi:hypothetical protein Hanom_Chr05g00432821 [Helianthus anomalus]
MHYCAERERVLKLVLVGAYQDREWYKTLTKVPTPFIQLAEKAYVAAGMSMMWVPKDPRAGPVYAFKGKVGYSLMKVLNSEVGGEMTGMLLPEGEKPWVDRIKDNFLHSSSESLAAYGVVILGAPFAVETEVNKPPTREETILLSSEESTGSSHGLIYRSTRAGPQGVGKGAEKKEPKKKNCEREPAGAQTQLDEQAALELSEKKRKVMGHIVAPFDSDVDLGVFTKKSGNLLEQIYEASSQKKRLDFQIVTLVCVCLYGSFFPLGFGGYKFLFFLQLLQSLLGLRHVVLRSFHLIFLRFHHRRLPQVAYGDSPIHTSPTRLDPKGKGPEEASERVVAEKETPPVIPRLVIQEGVERVEGLETDYESSEATPLQGTRYTRRGPSTSRGGGCSDIQRSLEFERMETGGSWMAHNPAYDNLPHIP